MVILGLISYILVGVCVAIGVSVYKYKDYKNSNSTDWDNYYERWDLSEWSILVIFAWPLISILAMYYVLGHIPRIVIKKYYKING